MKIPITSNHMATRCRPENGRVCIAGLLGWALPRRERGGRSNDDTKHSWQWCQPLPKLLPGPRSSGNAESRPDVLEQPRDVWTPERRGEVERAGGEDLRSGRG